MRASSITALTRSWAWAFSRSARWSCSSVPGSGASLLRRGRDAVCRKRVFVVSQGVTQREASRGSRRNVRKRPDRGCHRAHNSLVILDPRTCYRALKARDARFDGRFFVAVSSTRIYCRPVCTVRPPKRENCRFFPSAAAAESNGYRPCLRCRPELAPGNASVDATTRLAQAAASMMEDRALDQEGLDTLAARLGITDRHLRRAFGAEFGVSPVEFAQTQRLLLAKRLLTDTSLPVTEVAFASGFGSVRRFNSLFKQRYRLQPSALRRRNAGPPAAAADVLQFELSFRPPFDWKAISAFLDARSIRGVEAVEDNRYRRTVRVPIDGKEHRGW